MNYSASILVLQRVVEFVLFGYLKKWANDKTNFKLSMQKTARRSTRKPIKRSSERAVSKSIEI